MCVRVGSARWYIIGVLLPGIIIYIHIHTHIVNAETYCTLCSAVWFLWYDGFETVLCIIISTRIILYTDLHETIWRTPIDDNILLL